MDEPFYFVLPDDRHLPSGGNIYNEKLIEALRGAGHAVEILDFSAYQQAIKQHLPGYYWVDSLFIQPVKHLFTAKGPKTRSFFILHHLESLYPPPGKSSDEIFATQEQEALSFFNGFLVTSTFTEKYLRDRGFRQPVIVVEPARDLPVFPRSAPNNQLYALMVANVIERKGILDWLRSLGQLASPTDRFFLTIIGRTDMEPAYTRACQKEIITHPVLQGKVHFTGALSHAEVGKHYSKANLFISTAYMETYGMALQEARAYQLPIVTLRGGFAEHHVIPGKNGYIFNSAPEMANFFIDLTRDQAKFATLQLQTMQEQWPDYTWQQAAAKFFQHFSAF